MLEIELILLTRIMRLQLCSGVFEMLVERLFVTNVSAFARFKRGVELFDHKTSCGLVVVFFGADFPPWLVLSIDFIEILIFVSFLWLNKIVSDLVHQTLYLSSLLLIVNFVAFAKEMSLSLVNR